MPINNPLVLPNFTPNDHGLVAWSFDPVAATNAVITPAAGTLYVVRVKVPRPTLITAIVMMTSVAGATLTAGQNFAALFDAAGNRVGVTADQSTAWAGAAGDKDMPLTAPVVVSGPYCRVGFYSNGSTLPTWRTSGTSAVSGNTSLATAAARFGAADTGLTTTPPATLGTVTAKTVSWWVGLR